MKKRKVISYQMKRMKKLKKTRNDKEVEKYLRKIEESAADPGQNVLEAALFAARARATLGEISTALENVFGRFESQQGIVQQVYGNHMKNNQSFQRAQQLCHEFESNYGRRPHILVAKIGQDGHDRGALGSVSSGG